jgi:dihydrofolate reductase
MKVILYMAISADGFIATKDGDSEWVSEVDVPIFDKKIKDFGCIILGSKTFQQFRGKYFPKKDAINIVISSNPEINSKDGSVYAKSPKKALEIAKNKGFEKVLLIGGGHINGSFLKEKLVDEIFLDVHPLIFGEGIKVFEGFETRLNLEKVDFELLDKGQVLLHYKVLR